MRQVRGAAVIAFVAFGIAGARAQAPAAAPPGATAPVAAPESGSAPDKPAAATGTAPAASGKTPTAAVVVGLDTLEGVTGKSVRSETGEDMGRITDILVGANGEPRAAVIDFGGFLGVGSRKAAVDWKTLDFADSIKSGSVKVSLTRDQVRQSPEYKTSEPVVILEASKPSPTPASQISPQVPPAH